MLPENLRLAKQLTAMPGPSVICDPPGPKVFTEPPAIPRPEVLLAELVEDQKQAIALLTEIRDLLARREPS